MVGVGDALALAEALGLAEALEGAATLGDAAGVAVDVDVLFPHAPSSASRPTTVVTVNSRRPERLERA